MAAPRRTITGSVELDLDQRLADNQRLLQARMLELAEENERLRRQLAPADVHNALVVVDGVQTA